MLQIGERDVSGGWGVGAVTYGGELPLYWSPFLTFSDPIGFLFMPNSILLNPSFCRKNQFVPIRFSSRNNLSYFSQKSVIWPFWNILCQFFLDFRSHWPPFLQFLDLFDPLFLQNLRSRWVHFFIVGWAPPLRKNWWSAPPPWGVFTHPGPHI